VGISPVVIAKVRGLIGQSFATPKEIYQYAIPNVLTKQENEELTKIFDQSRIEAGRVKLTGPVRSFRAGGWLGCLPG
jgi:hypothetical protein